MSHPQSFPKPPDDALSPASTPSPATRTGTFDFICAASLLKASTPSRCSAESNKQQLLEALDVGGAKG